MSGFMFASFLSRVMPALCTTMSTPPNVSLHVLGDPLGRVLAGDVEGEVVAAQLLGDSLQLAGRLGYVDAEDPRAVAVQHPGDLLADAAAGPGDQRDLALERARPVGDLLGSVSCAVAADPDDLAGDVGGLGGEQEAAGSRRAPPGGRAPRRRRRRAATVPPRPISLPSERVKPSSARWATRSAPWTDSGGVPSTTTRGQRPRLRSSGVKNSLQCDELLAGREAGRVEDQRLVAVVAGRGRCGVAHVGDAERVEAGGQRLVEAAVAADGTTARRPAGRPRRSARAVTGLGRPRFLASSWPTGVWIRLW